MNTKRISGIAFDIIILMMLFMFASCSSTQMDAYNQSLGSFKESPEVTRLFKTYQKHPDYKYYYAGFMKDPEAVVGIHNDYMIFISSDSGSRAGRWKEFEPTPQNLEMLVKGIGKNDKPYGADILDPAGKQVGILYTFKQQQPLHQPLVRMIEDNLISVVPHYPVVSTSFSSHPPL
jgi:hypothetical protein